MNRIEAKDIMATKLVTLRPELDVSDAIDILLKYKITGAPVLDEDGQFLGVFSERNCMRVLVTGTYHEMPSAKVAAYMDPNPLTIDEHADLLAVAQLFLNDPIRRLPVLKRGKLVGQVSRRDVLRAMQANTSFESRRDSRTHVPLYLSAVTNSLDEYPIN